MSWIVDDPDTYLVVNDIRPCTACSQGRCIGMCNGMAMTTRVMRPPEEVARIKAERLRRQEDDILARAAEIVARRAAAGSGAAEAAH